MVVDTHYRPAVSRVTQFYVDLVLYKRSKVDYTTPPLLTELALQLQIKCKTAPQSRGRVVRERDGENDNKGRAGAAVTGHDRPPECSRIQQIVYPLEGNSKISKCSDIPTLLLGEPARIFRCI